MDGEFHGIVHCSIAFPIKQDYQYPTALPHGAISAGGRPE
jgi:hypothetical protein